MVRERLFILMVLSILFITLMVYKQRQKNKKLQVKGEWVWQNLQNGLQSQQKLNLLSVIQNLLEFWISLFLSFLIHFTFVTFYYKKTTYKKVKFFENLKFWTSIKTFKKSKNSRTLNLDHFNLDHQNL